MIKFSQIIAERKRFLERDKKYTPLTDLKDNIRGMKIRADFKKALTRSTEVALICEYKPASPSAGDISNLKVEDVVPLFQKGGASAISILTEETFFKSNIKNLKIASKISEVPLLRKDFIIDEYQIYESRSYGASAILLMADVYPDLKGGVELCQYLGMDALVECKNKAEIEQAIQSGAEIIGINNRNFKDFTINFERTQKLAQNVPSDKILVSESGIKNIHDVEQLSHSGINAVLVGSSLMTLTQPDLLEKKVREMANIAGNVKKNNRLKIKICGITRLNDLQTCQNPGVDFIGFINIKRSKRFVSTEKIVELTSSIPGKESLGNKVLVIEPQSPDEVGIKVAETGIHTVQLHSLNGKEISKIKKTHFTDRLKVCRVIGLTKKISKAKEEEIKEFAGVCECILFDYEYLGHTGGTGIQIPLDLAIEAASIARNIKPDLELALAGGMDAERIRTDGKRIAKYYDILDLNSGVENEPGIKNPNKIAAILKLKNMV